MPAGRDYNWIFVQIHLLVRFHLDVIDLGTFQLWGATLLTELLVWTGFAADRRTSMPTTENLGASKIARKSVARRTTWQIAGSEMFA